MTRSQTSKDKAKPKPRTVQVRVRPGAHDIVHAAGRRWVAGEVYTVPADEAKKALAASPVLEAVRS